MSSRRPVRLLLVEDNPSDILLIKEGLRTWKAPYELTVIEDGAEAVALAESLGGPTPNTLPDLILLDLNLPKKSGWDVLDALKSSEETKSIPIIILTSSNAGSDVQKAYRNCANCYLSKPIDLDEFLERVQAIETFWIRQVLLPSSV
jgi:two-component system, chemotaxis family, response regulator Rcp1